MISHFPVIKSKSLACFKTVYMTYKNILSVTGFRTNQETHLWSVTLSPPTCLPQWIVLNDPMHNLSSLSCLYQVSITQKKSKGHIWPFCFLSHFVLQGLPTVITSVFVIDLERAWLTFFSLYTHYLLAFRAHLLSLLQEIFLWTLKSVITGHSHATVDFSFLFTAI